MAEFPIIGILREPILVLEAVVILLSVEFGLFFVYRFIKEEKEKNYMMLALFFFFFTFAGMEIFFILSDFYSITPEMRDIYIKIGYILMATGGLGFVFNTERELLQKKHFMFIFMSLITSLLYLDLFLLFIEPVYLAYLAWVLFIIVLFIYFFKAKSKIKEYQFNIYGFFFGFLLASIGYAFTTNAMVESFGYTSRLIGDITIITGLCLISFLFIGLPSLSEIDWAQKLNKLLLMHESGTCICEFDFHSSSKETPQEGRVFPKDFVADSLIGISKMITELIRSKQRLEVLDHQDKQIIFSYGKNLIVVLIVDEFLQIYKIKLEKLISDLELVYGGVLRDWKGQINDLKPIERLIRKTFS